MFHSKKSFSSSLRIFFFFCFFVFYVGSTQGQGLSSSKPPKEYLLGNILKSVLESNHFSQKKLDNAVSLSAYKLLLEKYDFKKQFFLASDIKKFNQYEYKLDEQMLTGKLEMVDQAKEILDKRIKVIRTWVDEILKKPFNFQKREKIETDGEKRKFAKNLKELKRYWRKYVKYVTLNEILKLEEEQKNEIEIAKKEKNQKKKKKKDSSKKTSKKKKFVKKSFKQLEVQARKNVKKDLGTLLSRLEKEKKVDQLSKYFNSISQVFDPHTTYLPPDDRENFYIHMSGKLEGIGAVLYQDGPYTKVERIVPGSASWRQKELKKDDTILKVGQNSAEPTNIVGMDLRDAVKLIRGEKGTEVRLTVRKPEGVIKIIPIIRDVVEIEESYAKGALIEHKESKKKIGYISLPSFYRDFNPKSKGDIRNCTDDVRAELKKLKKMNVDALILDLRNNGGGSLDDARMITGFFIEKGPVVQVKAHTGNISVLSDYDSEVVFNRPLIIMLNKFSASASEILAGALKDYNRAILVGSEFTHGKGTVQQVINLDQVIAPLMSKFYDSLGALKITIQKFYRINGSSTQQKGVAADLLLPDRFDFLESGERHLDYSLPWGKVPALSYKKWQKKSINVSQLQKLSQKRVGKNQAFRKIKKYTKWMKDQVKLTKRSINYKEVMTLAKERENVLKEYKEEKKSLNMTVKTTVKKVMKEADKIRNEEFIEKVLKDPYIEETVLIARDLLKQGA